ncbi:MAG: hypothetical protein Q9214_006249 [Letrouitia sp. 1 TL-2023]
MKRSYEEACQEIYRRSRILAAQGGFIGNLAYLAEWPADEAECFRLSGIKNNNTNTNTDFNTSQGFQNAAPTITSTVDLGRKAYIRQSSTQSSTPATSRPHFAKSRPLYPFKTMPTAPKRPSLASNVQNETTQSFSQTSKKAMTIDPIFLAYNPNKHRFEADFTFTCPSGLEAEGNNPKLAGSRKFQAKAPPVPLWSKPSNFSGPSTKVSANKELSSSKLFDEFLAQQLGPIFSEDQDKIIYDALNSASQDMDTSVVEGSQDTMATDSSFSLSDEDESYPEKFALSPDEQEDTMSICLEGGDDNDSKSPSDGQYSAYESPTSDDNSESDLSSVASDFEEDLPVKSGPHKRTNRAPTLAQRRHGQPVNKRQKVTKKRGSVAISKDVAVSGKYQTRSRVCSLRSRKD